MKHQHLLQTVIFIMIITWIFNNPVSAQKQLIDSVDSKQRVFTDGYMKVKLGTNTILELSPAVCYQITSDLSAGFGITYQYYQNQFDGSEMFKTHNKGFRFVADYHILKNKQLLMANLSWYARIEQEFMNLDGRYFYNPPREGRYNTMNTLAGVKCKYPVLKRLDINLLVLWNIYQTGTDYNLNENPVLKFGINYKF
ncbi:MAG: hypothetical protein JEZ03_17515 [Bacteroidales bacterium]|nr:hypothetical protein [Bacteroidales bacterium]